MLKNTINHFQEKQNKISKKLKIITQQPKTLKISNIVDIKSVITEHLKS